MAFQGSEVRNKLFLFILILFINSNTLKQSIPRTQGNINARSFFTEVEIINPGNLKIYQIIKSVFKVLSVFKSPGTGSFFKN